MQGWGGVGGDPGPYSPSSLVAAEVGGGLSQAGPGRGEHSFSHGLYGEPREPPLGSERGGRTTPRLWAHIASSRGRPCPPGRLPAWISTWCQERAGAQAGKGGGVGGAESGELGSGGEPTGLHPIILRSWSSGLPGGAPAEQRACAGEGSP